MLLYVGLCRVVVLVVILGFFGVLVVVEFLVVEKMVNLFIMFIYGD